MSTGPIRETPPRPLPPVAPTERPASVDRAEAFQEGSGGSGGSGEPSAFARLLRTLSREASRGEAHVKGALAAAQGGRDLGAAELLALQAGVYRYSEAVDLASKLVDRATTGVKTVVQSQ